MDTLPAPYTPPAGAVTGPHPAGPAPLPAGYALIPVDAYGRPLPPAAHPGIAAPTPPPPAGHPGGMSGPAALPTLVPLPSARTAGTALVLAGGITTAALVGLVVVAVIAALAALAVVGMVVHGTSGVAGQALAAIAHRAGSSAQQTTVTVPAADRRRRGLR